MRHGIATLSAITVFGAGTFMGYAVTDTGSQDEPAAGAGMCHETIAAVQEIESAPAHELASAVNRVLETDMACRTE